MHELPLVFFTILAQAAVGIWVMAYVARIFDQLSSVKVRHANGIAAFLMALALGIGMLHMGQPLRFMNVLWGLGRSAMSFEALMSGLFFGGMVLWLFLSITNKLSSKSSHLLQLAVAILGIIFIGSIIEVYRIETVVTWATIHTTVQMLVSTLLIGGVIIAGLGARVLGTSGLIVGSLLAIMTKVDYILTMARVAPELAQAQTFWWSAQLMLFIMGLMIFSLSSRVVQGAKGRLIGVSVILIMMAELCGRVAFYNLWTLPM